MTRIIAVEDGPTVRLPADWAAEIGIHGTAALEKTPEGILIRPAKPRGRSWDDLFAHKLRVRTALSESGEPREAFEISGDDLLF